eukprot:1192188-Prorocentrum_minimum.AAC.1
MPRSMPWYGHPIIIIIKLSKIRFDTEDDGMPCPKVGAVKTANGIVDKIPLGKVAVAGMYHLSPGRTTND